VICGGRSEDLVGRYFKIFVVLKYVSLLLRQFIIRNKFRFCGTEVCFVQPFFSGMYERARNLALWVIVI
jgi:hypothetical protein